MSKQYAIDHNHFGMLLYYLWEEAGLPSGGLGLLSREQHTELVNMLVQKKTAEVEEILAARATKD